MPRNSLDYDCVHFTPAAAAADRAFNKAPSGGLMGKSGRDGDAGWDQGWMYAAYRKQNEPSLTSL